MNSIALIEFSSMAQGIGYTHRAIKNTNVLLHKQELMCPGKYVVMLKGRPQALDFAKGLLNEVDTVIHSTFLYKLHPTVMASINRSVDYKKGGNYIVIETKYFVDSIALGDVLVKQTNLCVERVVDRLGLFGKGLLICSGSSSQLQLAKQVVTSADYEQTVVSVAVLEAVQEDVFNF